MRPKPDASKWYADQKRIEDQDKAQKAQQEIRKKLGIDRPNKYIQAQK